jgi:hypothetical protein
MLQTKTASHLILFTQSFEIPTQPFALFLNISRKKFVQPFVYFSIFKKLKHSERRNILFFGESGKKKITKTAYRK